MNRFSASISGGKTPSVRVNTVLYDANAPLSHAYFPTNGCVSMVNAMADGAVEVGTIGYEGWAGLPLLLGEDQMPTRAFVPLAGDSYRMTAASFEKSVASNPKFARLLNLRTDARISLLHARRPPSRSHACRRRSSARGVRLIIR